MNHLYTCEVNEISGDTHILRDRTIDELHGSIGPQWPILLDGKPGHLTAMPDDVVRFVPDSA